MHLFELNIVVFYITLAASTGKTKLSPPSPTPPHPGGFGSVRSKVYVLLLLMHCIVYCGSYGSGGTFGPCFVIAVLSVLFFIVLQSSP